MEIDWPVLRAAATEAMRHAYAPYSDFPVGVAGLVDDGRVVVGCNVENASYGVTLCAECGLVSALHASGGGRLVAVACVDGAGNPLMPCGRCRQLLWEHGGAECLVDAVPEPLRMAELLPHAFGADDLDAARGGSGSAVPARLANWRGRGTVFVHLDMAGGQRVWTGYWERSAGFWEVTASEHRSERSVRGASVPGPPGESPHGAGMRVGASAERTQAANAGPPADDTGVGILEEAPSWPTAAEAVAWGLARTPRVVVIDADGKLTWAGEAVPPSEIPDRWQNPPAGP
jgi:cytidine deaminase